MRWINVTHYASIEDLCTYITFERDGFSFTLAVEDFPVPYQDFLAMLRAFDIEARRNV